MATLRDGPSSRPECVEPSPVLPGQVQPLGARPRSRSRSPGPEDGDDDEDQYEDEACKPGSLPAAAASAVVAAGTTQPSGGSAPLKRPHLDQNGSLGDILRKHYEERWRKEATTNQIAPLLNELFPKAIAAARCQGDLPTTFTEMEFEEILFSATLGYKIWKEARADGADVDDALQEWANDWGIHQHKDRLWIFAFVKDAIKGVQ